MSDITKEDFFKVKNGLEKAKEEISTLKSENSRLKKRLEVVNLDNVEDKDLKDIQQLFLDREAELDTREDTLKAREDEVKTLEASFKERDKEVQIQSLVSKYAPSDEKELAKFKKAVADSDDPEKKAMSLYLERLDSEGKKEPENPAEEVFESKPAGGKIKKEYKDMTPEEFKAEEAKMKQEYYAKV